MSICLYQSYNWLNLFLISTGNKIRRSFSTEDDVWLKDAASADDSTAASTRDSFPLLCTGVRNSLIRFLALKCYRYILNISSNDRQDPIKIILHDINTDLLFLYKFVFKVKF